MMFLKVEHLLSSICHQMLTGDQKNEINEINVNITTAKQICIVGIP